MEKTYPLEAVYDLRGKTLCKGLFGEDLVIVREEERPTVLVSTKLTKAESDAVEGWAYKFGMPKSKMIRDMIRQQLRDFAILHTP